MTTNLSLVLCGTIAPWQFILIALIVLLLFGGKKIPELMRGIGKGIRNFKEGMREVEDDISNVDKTEDSKKNQNSIDNKIN